ncbi:MAG: branched-chain amino acid ABC transporter permease [Chloroflexi bacterium]|nr:branched-chain amino acid ABC transporter permease [Chloroflexota bacterium]MBU1746388.1 branched-chain amino acid ABC transporter permease [Chloroflexota bacterium]
MEVWGQQLVNGVTIGGIYALIALGYTLVYGILFMINFAHGEIFMVGAYAGYFTLLLLIPTGLVETNTPLVLATMFIVGMTTSALLAVAVERIAYRPLRRAARLAPLISAIGASLFLQNAMMILTKAELKVVPPVFPDGKFIIGPFDWGFISMGEVTITYLRLFMIVFSILLMMGLYVFVQRTRIGKAMRAVAADKDTAALMGIDVNRIISITFLLGGGLAGAAGVMVGLYYTQLRHMMGFVPGIKAFTAAVLGGIGNVPGAMVGGFVLGIAETMGAQIISNDWKDVIAFGLLVLILIFRPRGLLGEVVAEKS